MTKIDTTKVDTTKTDNTKIDTTERNSFILYSSYEEQLNLLTDQQAGQLFKSIYVYVRTGEKHSDDPMVNLLLSVISHQLDQDAKKYEERKERCREAGKKGGRPRKSAVVDDVSASIQENINPTSNMFTEENPTVFLEKPKKGRKPVDVYVDEDEDVDEYVDDDVDVDLERIKQQQRRQQEEDDARVRAIFPFGRYQTPTMAYELEKVQQFAEQLFHQYHTGIASRMDVECVFDAVYRPAYTANDEGYAAFDRDKADLLEFAFQQAAEQGQVKWSYINAILDKYRKNGIETVADAQDFEYRRNRGEVL